MTILIAFSTSLRSNCSLLTIFYLLPSSIYYLYSFKKWKYIPIISFYLSFLFISFINKFSFFLFFHSFLFFPICIIKLQSFVLQKGFSINGLGAMERLFILMLNRSIGMFNSLVIIHGIMFFLFVFELLM